jgi:hypothetical protein
MSKHLYLRSDGNGGLVISKVLAAIISIMAILGPIVGFIIQAKLVEAKVDVLNEKIAESEAHEISDELRFRQLENSQVEYGSDIKYLTQKVEKIDSKLDRVLETR